jgi:hypothetical protein
MVETKTIGPAAQQPGRVRRIGVLMSTAADDGQGQAWSAAFLQGLQQLGWEVGGNIRIDYRWGTGDTDRFRRYAAELVALGPDVILGTAGQNENPALTGLCQLSPATDMPPHALMCEKC